MDLTLKRTEFSDDGIFGELSDITGKRIAFTLEHSYSKVPKLPPGQYVCRRGLHRLEGMTDPFETFEIEDVPGHSDILFHVGNYNKDSQGCVLLGRGRMGPMLKFSRFAFEDFLKLQAGFDEFTLTVLES